jgi:MFS family permease
LSGAPAKSRGALAAIPRGVWVLGLGSLFMDASSEMIHGLLPVFMVSVLGASTVALGLIEGVAEAAAAITRVFSGAFSDYFQNRKGPVVFGYALSAAVKPLFPLAAGLAPVFAARFLDRVGKGIRGAPRDALVGDLTPPKLRGAAYGLRQSLDSLGAVVGPLMAVALMVLFAGNFRAVFWVALAPAFIAVALLWGGLKAPAKHAAKDRGPRLHLADFGRLRGAFWWVVLIGGAMTLARFSEAFLVLRAGAVGLSLALLPLVLAVMSVVYALSAYPAGALADRFGFAPVLGLGLAALVAANAVLGLGQTPAIALAGVALWGLHMGLTQGVLAALVAGTAPADLRASAFGVFTLITGVLLFFASLIAGALWAGVGPSAPFAAGAAFAALALLTLALSRGKISVSGA